MVVNCFHLYLCLQYLTQSIVCLSICHVKTDVVKSEVGHVHKDDVDWVLTLDILKHGYKERGHGGAVSTHHSLGQGSDAMLVTSQLWAQRERPCWDSINPSFPWSGE